MRVKVYGLCTAVSVNLSALKLEDLIRLQQDYNTKVWKKQIELIEHSSELDGKDLKAINDITQHL